MEKFIFEENGCKVYSLKVLGTTYYILRRGTSKFIRSSMASIKQIINICRPVKRHTKKIMDLRKSLCLSIQ